MKSAEQVGKVDPAAAPAWLRARRAGAAEVMATLPKPSSHADEDWRRTDISKLDLDTPRAMAEPDAELERSLAEEIAPLAGSDPVAIVAAGSAHATSIDRLTAQGIIVADLAEAATLYPDLVQRGLSDLAADTFFSARWNAGWRRGTFVYVPPATDAALPLWLLTTLRGEGEALPATLICVDDEASAVVTDGYASRSGEEALRIAGAGLWLGRNARLQYTVVQDWAQSVWHVGIHRARLGAGATLAFGGITLGSRLQKAYWESILDGEGADARLRGIAVGSGRQHLDHQTLQAHRAPHTVSRCDMRTAVRDTATSVYGGLIDVERTAQHTDAYVQNRNLLLSRGASADSVPRLEIRANDVRCGHGATASHIDETERFYLMARGVPAAEADRLIVRGFFEETLNGLPEHGGTRAFVASRLERTTAGS